MKNSLLLKQVLNKVPLENKVKLEEALNALPDTDLPDEFEAVITALGTLHTDDSAKASKTLNEYHTNKFKKNQTQNWQSRLQAMGFDENEIQSVLSKPFEQQWEAALVIDKEKLQKQHSMSETELVRAEKERSAQEKARADRLQAAAVERENFWKTKIENEKLDFHLRNIIAGLEVNDNLPKDKAAELLFNDTINKLNAMNAKLTYGAQGLRLVQGEDTALDLYDERNNLVTVSRIVEEVRHSLNLTPKVNVRNNNQQSSNLFQRNSGRQNDPQRPKEPSGNQQMFQNLAAKLLAP